MSEYGRIDPYTLPRLAVLTRCLLLASELAGVVRAEGASSEIGMPKRPNIVIILCDDLGYGDLGCYGNTIVQTPNLDRFARQGTRLTEYHTTSPVCSPSRAALMTGRYPQRYGIHHADLPEFQPRYWLPESALTIAEVLKQAGYATAHVGKWHLGEPPDAVMPRKQGFDFFAGTLGGRPSSSWIKYARSLDPEVIINEERPVVELGHVTEVQTQTALDFISTVKPGQPFFLNLWFNAPHEPLAPLPDQAELYRDWSPEEQTYFQTVTDIDRGVGRILARLDELGISNDTLVLFTNDNGPEAHSFRYSRGSAGPLKGMKTQLWEGGIRVPAIVRWPREIPSGHVSRSLASVLDIFPTICALASAPVPAGLELDGGIDLIPVLKGTVREPSRALFFEFHFPQRGVGSSLPMAVRKSRWKLFADYSFSKVELYDLSCDIGEKHDVAGQNEEVSEELKAELRRWWAQLAPQIDLNVKPARVPVPTPEELEKRYYHN